MEQGDVDEFPGITAQGYSNLGNNNGPYYSSNQLNYNFSGSVMRVIGKHSLSIGAEHRDYFLNFIQTNPLLMNFANDMTQGPDPLAVSADAGDGVASMLLGTGTSGSAGYYAHPANANHYFGQFIQDDIKWSRNLTINVGFRLEEETATTERYNQMAAIDPYVLNPISNQVTNPFNRAEAVEPLRRIRVRGQRRGRSRPQGDPRHRNQAEPAYGRRLFAESEDRHPGRLRPVLWRAV